MNCWVLSSVDENITKNHFWKEIYQDFKNGADVIGWCGIMYRYSQSLIPPWFMFPA